MVVFFITKHNLLVYTVYTYNKQIHSRIYKMIDYTTINKRTCLFDIHIY